MVSTKEQRVFFVDDEPAIRRAAGKTMAHLRCEVKCFANATDCLEQLRLESCDVLVTDVKMPGMDGISLLREAKRIAPWMPVLVITGYGDIPLAVRAIKAGASDFIEKPLEQENFLNAVQSALDKKSLAESAAGKLLTKMELTVLRLVLGGMSNKEVAGVLNRSVRTIEDHRLHIMRKLNVSNTVELIKRAGAMGLMDYPTEESNNFSKGK